MSQQLTLTIKLQADATLENFSWQSNELLHTALLTSLTTAALTTAAPTNNPVVPAQAGIHHQYYLWGATGAGKSHILQACCKHYTQQGIPCAYLPLTQIMQYDLGILEGIENLRLVCIDDIECIAQNLLWEEALFHLYNKIHNNAQTILIITGNVPPTALKLTLADLQSRLSWGIAFQLKPLDEAAKLTVLCDRAQQRGLELPLAVSQFLIKRCARDMQQLLKILEQLDQASLAAQRRLTIPFVKQVLGV